MAVNKVDGIQQHHGEIQAVQGAIRLQPWTAPAAANATLILSAKSIATAGSTTTFAGQPDFPRNVQVVASGAATGNVVVTGTNIRDEVITETLALNGATPVLGAKAFKTITQVDYPAVAATTINLGSGVKLGLDRKMSVAAVVDAYTDGVREATAATVAFSSSAVESNTVQTNTAPNGTRNFKVAFITDELTAKNQTTV